MSKTAVELQMEREEEKLREAGRQNRVTGKYSRKSFLCRNCGKTSEHGTNHWGSIYMCCPHCPPFSRVSSVLDCTEDPPEGVGKPEEWKQVKLGDICEIKEGLCP